MVNSTWLKDLTNIEEGLWLVKNIYISGRFSMITGQVQYKSYLFIFFGLEIPLSLPKALLLRYIFINLIDP